MKDRFCKDSEIYHRYTGGKGNVVWFYARHGGRYFHLYETVQSAVKMAYDSDSHGESYTCSIETSSGREIDLELWFSKMKKDEDGTG